MRHLRRDMSRPLRRGFADDEFSAELKAQGEDGRKMRGFYLRPWTVTYQKRVQDESIHD